MNSPQQQRNKLESAAQRIVELVGASVGRMLSVEQIVLYGNTESKQEQIFRTLEGYGFEWKKGQWVKKDGQWALTISPWINTLVAKSWYHYETVETEESI